MSPVGGTTDGPAVDLVKRCLANPDLALLLLDRDDCRRRLMDFVGHFWGVIEPSRPLVRGWVMEAICEHLQAVTEGQITRLLINVPPGTSKPVSIESLVSTRRGRVRLADIVVGDEVLTHRGRYRKVLAVHDQGVLPLLRVTTECGRSVEAAGDHPFLTPNGWKRLDEVDGHDVLAAIVPTEPWTGAPMDPREARFLGYLVGDGSVKYTRKSFTNADPEVLDDFEACAQWMGFTCRRTRKAVGIAWQISLSANRSGRLQSYLTDRGLNGQDSYTKRIPPAVLAADDEALAHFIGAYWTCDGTCGIRHTTETKTSYNAVLTTVSEGLARDTQHAMLRLGIGTRIRRRTSQLKTRKQGDLYVHWAVFATNQQQVAKIAKLPGLCSRKKMAIESTRLRDFETHIRPDPVVSVDAIGDGPCRCLSVEEDSSFTANDIAVHNSLLTSVFWPAWTWSARGLPARRFLAASYSSLLTIRDNRRCRAIIQSELFQRMWGDTVQLVEDQNAKTRFDNTATGWKIATSVSGMGTGERGDCVLVDDPHSVREGESEAKREGVLQWFTEVLPTRLNDPEKSAIVVIMQRVHERDVSGLILSKELNYDRLIIPMRYESDHPTPSRTTLGWKDPRTREGELMWPERFSERYLTETLEPELASWGGSYAIAGQLMQRPAPRGGGMFKRDHWKIVDATPDAGYLAVVRGWDLAASVNKTAAFTAGVKMRLLIDGRVVIEDVVRFRGSPMDVENQILACAEQDGVVVYVDLPQDPGQAGLHQKQVHVRRLGGFVVSTSPETGSKEERARPLAAQVEAGNVLLVRAPWNDVFMAEAAMFPSGQFKDQVDAATRAYAKLIALTRRPGRSIVGPAIIQA